MSKVAFHLALLAALGSCTGKKSSHSGHPQNPNEKAAPGDGQDPGATTDHKDPAAAGDQGQGDGKEKGKDEGVQGQTQPPADPTIEMSANHTYILPDDRIAIRWKATRATACKLNDQPVSEEGEQSIDVASRTAKYELTCKGNDGKIISKQLDFTYASILSLTVDKREFPFGADTFSIRASETLPLEWTAENFDSCQLNEAQAGSILQGLKASTRIGPGVYTLVCSSPKQQRTLEKSFTIFNTDRTGATKIQAFIAPQSVSSGNKSPSIEVSWDVIHPGTCTLSSKQLPAPVTIVEPIGKKTLQLQDVPLYGQFELSLSCEGQGIDSMQKTISLSAIFDMKINSQPVQKAVERLENGLAELTFDTSSVDRCFVNEAGKTGNLIETEIVQDGEWTALARHDKPGKYILTCVGPSQNIVTQAYEVAAHEFDYYNTFNNELSLTMPWLKLGDDFLPSDRITDLAWDSGSLYAVTNLGLSISKDLGKTWSNKTPRSVLQDGWIKKVAAKGETIVVVGSECTISKDGGKTWSSLSFARRSLFSYSHCPYEDIKFLDNGMMVADGRYISADQGTTFQKLAPIEGKIHSFTTFNNDIYVSSSQGLLKSSDLGATFKVLLKPHNAGDQVYSASVRGDDIIAIETIFDHPFPKVSRDGGKTWSFQQHYGQTKVLAASNFFYGYTKYSRDAADDTWTAFDKETLQPQAIEGWQSRLFSREFLSPTALIEVDGKIYVGSETGLLVYDGATNKCLQRITSKHGLQSLEIHDLTKQGTRLLAVSAGTLSVSTDVGKSWGTLAQSPEGFVTSLTVENNEIFVHTTQGLQYSSSGGLKWDSLQHPRTKSIYKVFIRSGILYVSTFEDKSIPNGSPSVYYSQDKGKSWTEIAVPGKYVEDIYSYKGGLFFATLDGLFVRRGTALEITKVSNLSFDQLLEMDGQLYGSARFSGLWKVSGDAASVELVKSGVFNCRRLDSTIACQFKSQFTNSAWIAVSFDKGATWIQASLQNSLGFFGATTGAPVFLNDELYYATDIGIVRLQRK